MISRRLAAWRKRMTSGRADEWKELQTPTHLSPSLVHPLSTKLSASEQLKVQNNTTCLNYSTMMTLPFLICD